MRMPAMFNKNEFDKLNDSVHTEMSAASEQRKFDDTQESKTFQTDGDVKVKKTSPGIRTGYRLLCFTSLMIIVLATAVYWMDTHLDKSLP